MLHPKNLHLFTSHKNNGSGKNFILKKSAEEKEGKNN